MALTQISTAGVKDDAVTAGKIPANAVGSSELADNAVDTNAIQADAVITSKIADDAITTAQIANNAVSSGQINDNAVGSNQIVSDAVVTSKIASGAITNNRLADQAVTLDKIEHGTSSNNGKFLRANNGADPTFETIPPAAITAVGSTGSNRVITDDGDGTATAESSLIFDGTKLAISGSTVGNGVSLEVTSAASNSDSRHIDLVRGGSHGYIGMAGSQPNDPLFLSRSGGRDVVITTAGKVGIGIPSGSQPDDTLDVVGNMQVSANSYQSNIYLSGNLFIGGTGTANALDDYEEGTYTPTLIYQNTSGLTLATNSASGKYTKIGNVCYVLGYINWSVSGSPINDNVAFGGLPFSTATGQIAAGSTRLVWNVTLYNTNAQNVTHQLQPYGNNAVSLSLESEQGNRSNELGSGSGFQARWQGWYFTA